MEQKEKVEEKLWWVRYVYKQELGKQELTTQHEGNAFFYAVDEATVHKRVASWLHHSKHYGVIVQAIEQVPLGFNLQFMPGLLQDLPEMYRLVTFS